MEPFYRERWANPSSVYPFGADLAREIEKARFQVAKLIGAKRPSEIVFTSTGTESDFTPLWSAVTGQPEKRHIVTTTVEHSAVLNTCEQLAKQGCEITKVPVDNTGSINLDELASAIRDDTAIVSVMWVNNESGVIFPISEIAEICKEKGVLFHVDAVQAAGKMPIDVSSIPIHFLSLSAHKLHGPKGVGALYIRRGTPFAPLFSGTQELGRRSGTENVASIIGFGAACEHLSSRINDISAKLCRFQQKIEGALQEIPDLLINGAQAARVGNTTNVSIRGIESEALLLMLARQDICASSGSACSTGNIGPSHVVKAMGVPREYASGTVRLSTSCLTTDAEVDHLLEVLPKLIQELR